MIIQVRQEDKKRRMKTQEIMTLLLYHCSMRERMELVHEVVSGALG